LSSVSAVSARVIACSSAFTAAASRDSIDEEQRCSSASAVSANVAPRSAATRQGRSLARGISADTAARSANSWQFFSVANTNSANAAACSADSWRHCTLASSANAFLRAVVSWRGYLSAPLAAANSADIAAHDAANSAHILFTAKSVAVFIAAAVIATARSTATWLSQD
jgi:hypothetical protein